MHPRISFMSSISFSFTRFVESSLIFHQSALPISAVFLVFLSLAPLVCPSRPSLVPIDLVMFIVTWFYLSQPSFLPLQPYPACVHFILSFPAFFTSFLLLCFSRCEIALSIFGFAPLLSLIFSTFCSLSMACSASLTFRYIFFFAASASGSSISSYPTNLFFTSKLYLILISFNYLSSLRTLNLSLTLFFPSALADVSLILVLTR